MCGVLVEEDLVDFEDVDCCMKRKDSSFGQIELKKKTMIEKRKKTLMDKSLKNWLQKRV